MYQYYQGAIEVEETAPQIICCCHAAVAHTDKVSESIQLQKNYFASLHRLETNSAGEEIEQRKNGVLIAIPPKCVEEEEEMNFTDESGSLNIEEQEDSEEDSEDDDETSLLPPKLFHKGFSPPSGYLPLPSVLPCSPDNEQQSDDIQPCDELDNKHLHVKRLCALWETQHSYVDATRRTAYNLYSTLARDNNNRIPPLTRFRRRLLRLAGHASLAHHRGRHELIFQTAYLFDLIMIEYTKFLIKSGSTSSDLSFTDFLRTHKCDTDLFHDYSSSGLEICRDKESFTIEKIAAMPREELRTLVITCLVLASKWNNSRYLPLAVLCSPPVGRVPVSNVVRMEMGLLSLFHFDIPFKISMLNTLEIVYKHPEGSAESVREKQLIFDLALLCIELATGDHKSLYFPSRVLVSAAIWIAEKLAIAALDWQTTVGIVSPGLQEDDCWRHAVLYHIGNVELEMKGALEVLSKLKACGRWTNQHEAPNVFGFAISSRTSSVLSSNTCLMTNIEVEAKTKTESLSLDFLKGPAAAAFDIFVAAIINDGHKHPHRNGIASQENVGLCFTGLRKVWNEMKAHIS